MFAASLEKVVSEVDSALDPMKARLREIEPRIQGLNRGLGLALQRTNLFANAFEQEKYEKEWQNGVALRKELEDLTKERADLESRITPLEERKYDAATAEAKQRFPELYKEMDRLEKLKIIAEREDKEALARYRVEDRKYETFCCNGPVKGSPTASADYNRGITAFQNSVGKLYQESKLREKKLEEAKAEYWQASGLFSDKVRQLLNDYEK